MPTNQSNRVWSSWPCRDRENGRARANNRGSLGFNAARRSIPPSVFSEFLRSLVVLLLVLYGSIVGRSISGNYDLFAAHFSLGQSLLLTGAANETRSRRERGRSIGFVRREDSVTEFFRWWRNVGSFNGSAGFNVNGLLKRIRGWQRCRCPHWSARISLEDTQSTGREKGGGGTYTSCMRVQRNSNRDTTVDPAANYTYGSHYRREKPRRYRKSCRCLRSFVPSSKNDFESSRRFINCLSTFIDRFDYV